jgi:hypothetical protein
MSEAGYDPVALARFFDKLEAHGGPGVPEFLSDHPSPGNRVEGPPRVQPTTARVRCHDGSEGGETVSGNASPWDASALVRRGAPPIFTLCSGSVLSGARARPCGAL